MPFRVVAPLVAVGLLAFGVLFVVLGIRMLTGDRRRRRTWERFPGRVVASRMDDGQVRCQVVYQRRDGTNVPFWNRYTSTMVGDPVGRQVEVLVNPADPRDAVVGRGLVGGGFVGVVFVVVGAFVALGGAVAGVVMLLVSGTMS